MFVEQYSEWGVEAKRLAREAERHTRQARVSARRLLGVRLEPGIVKASTVNPHMLSVRSPMQRSLETLAKTRTLLRTNMYGVQC